MSSRSVTTYSLWRDADETEELQGHHLQRPGSKYSSVRFLHQALIRQEVKPESRQGSSAIHGRHTIKVITLIIFITQAGLLVNVSSLLLITNTPEPESILPINNGHLFTKWASIFWSGIARKSFLNTNIDLFLLCHYVKQLYSDRQNKYIFSLGMTWFRKEEEKKRKTSPLVQQVTRL